MIITLDPLREKVRTARGLERDFRRLGEYEAADQARQYADALESDPNPSRAQWPNYVAKAPLRVVVL